MKKTSVALVLGSGGARGYAHIGVIEEIERRGYSIECVAGCSMGALIGGVYAAGGLQAYKEWVSGLDYLDVLRLLDFGFGGLGAIRGQKVFARLHEMIGDVNIEDLPIDFTAVSTDLTNQQEVWFQQGDLHLAMRASAAIPSLFAPVRQGKRVLVDGGLLNPLPIIPVVSSHCDLIMAVNLNGNHTNGYSLPVIERPTPVRQYLEHWVDTLSPRKWLHWGERVEGAQQLELLEQDKIENQEGATQPDDTAGPSSMLELVYTSFEVMQDSLTKFKIAGYPPDVIFNIPKRLCRFYDFQLGPELIELGRMVASDTLDKFESGQR